MATINSIGTSYPIEVAAGGTGESIMTQYALPVGGATDLDYLAVGATGEMLIGNTGANPSWSNTINITSITISGLGRGVVQSSAAGLLSSSEGTDGQLLVSSGTGAPSWANITASLGSLNITNGANTIDIDITGTTDHAVQIGNATGTLTSLGLGLTGQVLRGSTGADPGWGAVDLTTDVTGYLPVGSGGTGVGSITAHAIAVGDGTSAINEIAVGATGTILTGVTAGDPVWTTATYPSTAAIGTILVASGANTITTLAPDTAGYVLTDGGAGVAPSWVAPTVGTVTSVSGGTNISTSGTAADPIIDLDATITLTTVNATTFDTNVAAAGVTLSGTTLSADGSDADIDINITAKGTGQVIIDDLQLTTDLAVTEGGTGASTLTDHGVLVGSGTGAITPLAVGATGETIMGSTGADPTWTSSPSFGGSVTAATGMTITANDLTVSSGSIALPTTTATDGQITINGDRVFHTYGETTNANVFVGRGSGNFTLNTTAFPNGCYNNVGVGYRTLEALTIGGYENAACGANALRTCTTGNNNAALGSNALRDLTSGEENTAFGYVTLGQLTTGSNNTAIGMGSGNYGSGYNYTSSESDNICIGHLGVASESNVLRIGTNGSGDAQQNKAYIAGTYGVTPGGTLNVALIDSNHQLGSVATLGVANGGTGAATLTDHGILFGSGTSAITASAALTNGQLAIGNTGSDPSLATLTEGVGIDITNAAGSITIAANATTLNDQTGTTYTLVLGDAGKHITFTNAAAITVTVPTNAAVAFPIGTIISFSQGGAGQATFSGAVPPTLQSADSALTTVKQYSGGYMIKILTDTWRFFGDLEA